jgi:hypothetical protein
MIKEKTVRNIALLIVVLLATAGCATQGVTQTGSQDAGILTPATSLPDPQPTAISDPPLQESFAPRLMQSVTGGPPAIGIPLGGNLFQPVTGGPPIIGIPLGP